MQFVGMMGMIMGFMFVAMLGHASTAAAQASRCADCHFANPETIPAPNHLYDWDRSPHRRNNVGCESCHGGDATTFESSLAHRGILGSGNPASPIHRENIPTTCGTCHPGPFTNYQQSQHFALLNEGDRQVPICITCHGNVAANLLSPNALERRCDRCHGSDGIAPRPGRAADARALMEGAANVRESLNAALNLIERIRDPARRAQLEENYTQAEVPLIQARQAGHRFVFDALEERLGVARQRAADLLSSLVNPDQ